MRIEIISVSSIDDGAEVLLTVKFTDGVGEHSSKRKLLLFTDKYLELGLRKGSVIDEETFDMLESASNVCRAIKKGSELAHKLSQATGLPLICSTVPKAIADKLLENEFEAAVFS